MNQNFKFFIFDTEVTNDEIRKLIKTYIINLFKNCNLEILNAPNKQPGLHKIRYFTFQNKFY